jgi:hypothetical protein
VILAAALVCAPQARAQTSRDSLVLKCEQLASQGTCAIYGTSIVQLIARPDVFDGKRVRVVGYIHWEFEGNGLYSYQEDETRHLYANGVWVDAAPGARLGPHCQDRYVLVEGTFRASAHGHLGLWSGTISDITRCIPWA